MDRALRLQRCPSFVMKTALGETLLNNHYKWYPLKFLCNFIREVGILVSKA
jgi:hypothetical protein